MNKLTIGVPVYIPVIISHYTDNKGISHPMIELRRKITDQELMKEIISATFHKEYITVQPRFMKELESINSLLQKGIVYLDKDDRQLRFTF